MVQISNPLHERIQTVYHAQKAFFDTGITREYSFRKAQLEKLRLAVMKHEQDIYDAMQSDFKKSSFETYGTEIGPVLTDIRHMIKNLKSWMKPERVGTPLPFLPSASWIERDPLGITLIISPWNYPFLLMMRPLISAISGGNTIILKPSEISFHTSKIITKIIEENFPEEYIAVFEGDGALVVNELLSSHHFDHVFFTGSTFVGRQIMQMAAKHLSPVTLELGGKSPCIVDKSANIDFAAKKIAWGKLINAGQTCVAPDYVLVHHDVKEIFIEKLKGHISKMYGDDPSKSPDYPRIISDRRFDSLVQFFDDGNIIFGGDSNKTERYVGPTIMENIKEDAAVMKDEIFGPILPIITYKENEEAIEWIEKNPYPLALYVFSGNKKTTEKFIRKIRFGGGCVNNTIIHLGNPELPFGGVGGSGIGQYHGRHGFDTFTRQKSMVYTPTWLDAPLWYAPYKNNLKWIKKIFR
ncbi:MAG: aldehyde dehydrogenase [Chitinophagaceae bacterium]